MPHLFTRPVGRCRLIVLVLTLLLTAVSAPAAAQQTASNRLNAAFERAAREFDVPRDLLVAIAYAETHFDDHAGQPSVDRGYGLMHLVDNPRTQTLKKAARLLGASDGALKSDLELNVRGGAALLRAVADAEGLTQPARADLAAWYPVVAAYSNAADPAVARFYADEIFRLLNAGLEGSSVAGELVQVAAQPVQPRRGRYEDVVTIASTDYAPALWTPADPTNYDVASRESDYPINYVVIHTTQGSYTSAINWFQNPSSNVSAHYVIRSGDGQITQMVREKDIAWHAGNYSYNTQSIGIEHEGYVNDSSWYTDAMYKASAALTRNLCLKYGIPIDRAHIIGHNEVPGATHTDPGPNWDWAYYMALVTQSATWSLVVDNAVTAQFTASANWSASSTNTQRYGSNYRYATPQAVSDAAWFKATLPTAATYEVFVWYPARSDYNAATPFVIATTSGNTTVKVNQQLNGGKWVSLGLFNLNGGTYNVVGVSRWTSSTGFIIADAVRLVRR